MKRVVSLFLVLILTLTLMLTGCTVYKTGETEVVEHKEKVVQDSEPQESLNNEEDEEAPQEDGTDNSNEDVESNDGSEDITEDNEEGEVINNDDAVISDDVLVIEEEATTDGNVIKKCGTEDEIMYKAMDIEAHVKPYIIEDDLSNIENINQFGTFNDEQIDMIKNNGFIVIPTKEEQLFFIYENNEYMKIPSFITTDSVLHIYHIFYDYMLRHLEEEELLVKLESMTNKMVLHSVEMYNKTNDERTKNLLCDNIAYFLVAYKLMGEEYIGDIPEEAVISADEEIKLVNKGQLDYSALLHCNIDYSQYTVRGHYTKSDNLKKYFKSMMWYGQVPMIAYKDKERSLDSTMKALLMTYTMMQDDEAYADWRELYEVTSFFVGSSDDYNISDYSDIIIKAYGVEVDINNMFNNESLDIVYEEIDKLEGPKIVGRYVTVDMPVNKQFRFMGQRYVMDAEITQRLVTPIERAVPSALDIMAVLGSKRAEYLQLNVNKEQEKWDGYEKELNILKDEVANISEDTWNSNMYYGWLWTLQGLLKEFGEGYPSFMRNDAWMDKSLSTAISSLTELKHDTILYGKQSGAECGGGEEPPKVKGYVEPNIELYNKLLWLTEFTKDNLTKRHAINRRINNKLEDFEEFIQFLITCSVKELNNEELTESEYYQLLIFGGYLESLTLSLASDGASWYLIESDTDKNMALIADIHNLPGACLELGVGPAHEIYVVVPVNGKLYLTRGAVFSHYEFVSDKRLTNEEWQKMLKNDENPPQPKWIKSFIDKNVKEIPMPAEPYSSGC